MEARKKEYFIELALRAGLGLLFPPLSVYDQGVFAFLSVMVAMLLGGCLGVLWGFSGLGLVLGRVLSVLLGDVVGVAIAAVRKKRQPQSAPWKFDFRRRDAIRLCLRTAMAIIFPPFAARGTGCLGLLQIVLYTLLGFPFLGMLPGALLAILLFMKQHDYYRVVQQAV